MNRKAISSLSPEGEAILREQRLLRRERILSNPSLLIGAAGMFVILLLAVLVPILSEVDPNEMHVMERLSAPSREHLFGTDEFGRDVFTRVMYGARISLSVGGLVALFSAAFGSVIGILASYFRGLDAVLMRICDGLMAIPGVLFAMALMAAFGASYWNIVLALTIVSTPGVARIVRSGALVTREKPYVKAARIQGATDARILIRILFPSVLSMLIVQVSFVFATAIISEASLSFLGVGIPPPDASWGNMLQAAKQVITKAPWTAIYPGAYVVLSVLSLNLLGDGLRDFFDPRVRGGVRK